MSPLNNDKLFLHAFFHCIYFSHFSFCKEFCNSGLGAEPSLYNLVAFHSTPVNLWLKVKHFIVMDARGVFVPALRQK